MLSISELVGKTLKKVEVLEDGSEIVVFKTKCGEVYKMYHFQDCCENVEIIDVIGDVSDLIGEPIQRAEEVKHENENPSDVDAPKYQDSFTWTFYKIDTRKGGITIRWYGESNGYYSESVYFVRVES